EISKLNSGRRVRRILTRATVVFLVAWYISEYVLEDDEAGGQVGAKSASKALPKSSEDDGSDQEDAEEEGIQLPETMPEDAIFVPLWLPKEKPEYFYKGSDPEWKNYATLARDHEKCKKLQPRMIAKNSPEDIVGILVREINSSHKICRWFGQPIKARRVWLDFDFPTKAPIEYERPGIEITDDYIALTRRPVSEKEYKRVQNALWPQSIATSLYVSYRTFWSLQYARLKQYFHVRSEQGNEAAQLNPRALGLPPWPRPEQKEDTRLSTGLDKMADPKSTDGKSTGIANAKSPPKSSLADSPISSRILSSLPSIPQVTGDAAVAVTAFKQTVAKTWQIPSILERGQVPISGLIEIEGSRGFAVYDAVALYDPTKSTIVAISVQLRRAALKRQSPLGGP
ncbi:MAG: hypothetical protein Q9163_003185, partial [Psora crenata]